MRTFLVASTLCLAGILAAGCTPSGPAEEAVKVAEDALAAVHAEAQKYIPNRYGEVKARLDEARQALTSGDYAEALAKAQEVPAMAAKLGEAAAEARETLHARLKVDWERLGATVPGLLEALGGRLGELKALKKLPEGVSADAVERATGGIEVARRAWGEATAAMDGGNLEGAVARGEETERLALELMTDVGMTPPEAPAAGG